MTVETIIRFLGGLYAFVTLGILFYGIWRGGMGGMVVKP